MKRRTAAVLAAGLTVAVLTVVTASPASAAAPRCDGEGERLEMSSPYLPTGNTIFFPAYNHEERVVGWPAPDYPVTLGHGYWSCSLVRNSVGEGVRALQQNLNFCYVGIIGPRLEEDGQFGSLTKAALARAQRYHGIQDNGEYGPQSARTLYHKVVDPTGGVGSEWCTSLTLAGWPGNSG